MKIVFLVKYYDRFIDSLEAKLQAAATVSYQDDMQLILNASSNIFAPFVDKMRKLGHETEMIIPNFERIQKKWAEENHVSFNKNWNFEIAAQQIKKMNPDILFTSSNFEYYGDFLSEVKPHVGKIYAWISCPIDKNLNLDNIDHIFTLFEPHQKYFTSIGKPCTLTKASFDSDVLNKLQKRESIDLSFVGGIGGYHHEREKALRYLVKRTPLKIWGYGFKSDQPIKNILKQVKTKFAFTNAYQGEAWGIDMLEILYNSKITFNVHGDIALGHAVNMRMFEATGVGTLLVTEYSPGIEKYFEPEKEVVCYSSYQEAVEKIHYYLENETERQAIAKAGQQRTLKDHNFDVTTKQLLQIFESL